MCQIIIVGHPIRKRKKFLIDNIEYLISFDGFKNLNKNEDPFIWNDKFLYTFCHTNESLNNNVRNLILNNKDEVFFVFVSKIEENHQILEIDTILKASEIYEWPEQGNRSIENLPSKIFNEKVIKYHLPLIENKKLAEHDKTRIFTCIGDKDESFLPMKKINEYFRPYQLSENLSREVFSLIQVENNRAYYVAKQDSPRLNKGNNEIFEDVRKELIKIIYSFYQNNPQLSRLKAKDIKDLDKDYRKE